ncbi:ABC transporter substrate-binding protein [Conyzicola sp.]|uniref:ABC transporter substrate-binding protein n=1 Tax=Conyzicola sp. TaxID=1969404 RepID=UPI00398A0467
MVPENVRAEGVLDVATINDYPPFAYTGDDGSLQGFDIDMVTAIADQLSLDVSFAPVAFETIIPSVQNGRYDMGAAGIGDLVERQNAVDFVDAYRTVVGFMVPAGNPGGLTATSDLCGLSMIAGAGAVEIGVIEGLSADCEAEGKQPIGLQVFADTTTEMLALAGGRADAVPYDVAVAAYIAGTEYEGVELSDRVLDEAATLSGYAFSKQNTELTAAVQSAINEMIDDGSYQAIFDKWGVGDTELDEATINGATS